jgi:FtsP/CotA-like multicopper oxidase with cupredoxin domain
MNTERIRGMTRRKLLLSSGCLFLAQTARVAAENGIHLAARLDRVRLTGEAGPDAGIWAYNGSAPGPLLRLRQGEPTRVVVENQLDQVTTVHWHGIRVPNAMDGVPGLTQPPIKPGENFVYEFTPPDAGTFWYHPHANSLEQLGRGLAGPIIVEERESPWVDRDILWFLQDWRLTDNGEIAPGFGNPMEAAMSGRVGNTVTLNGRVSENEPARAGERVRLRLVNGCVARMMALRFEGHRPMVVAIDGQPCEPHEPDGGRILLGPAMRIDVALDLMGEPGRHYAVTDDFYQDLAYTLTYLAYGAEPPLRAHPLDAPLSLSPNPLPEPDLASAERHEIALQGGMMSGMGGMMGGSMMGGGKGSTGGMMSGSMMGGKMGGMTKGMGATKGMGGAEWSINGVSMTGDGQAGVPPLLKLERGRTVMLALRNETAWLHPMHLHGHSFRVLKRNGSPVPYRQSADTVLVSPQETVDVAFVADNPGDWMLHCHVMDHQTAGLMTVLRVA